MLNKNKTPQPIMIVSTKSIAITIILTVIFGPLGMFYSTIWGAIIMIIISIIIGILTLGVGLVITWPISIIWGVLATSSYNKKLLAQAR